MLAPGQGVGPLPGVAAASFPIHHGNCDNSKDISTIKSEEPVSIAKIETQVAAISCVLQEYGCAYW